MAEAKPFKLPVSFTPGTKYMIDGRDLNEWHRKIMADRVIAGAGIQESEAGPGMGRIFTTGVGGKGLLEGAFTRIYEQDDNVYLQCGLVTGANGGEETISDYPVVLDADTFPLAKSGDVLYLSCNVTAYVEDGIVLPGLELNSATLTETMPTMHTFTADSPTGTIFQEIGRWNNTAFLPSGPTGNKVCTGCLANYRVTTS